MHAPRTYRHTIRLLLLLVAVTIAAIACVRRPTVTILIPDNYPPARRAQLMEACEKGEVLYKANCSGCHGIFAKAKDSIPDFSIIQIDNYGARFLRGDPTIHAVARKMSQEQLDQVLVFLRYRHMALHKKDKQ